MTPCLQDVLDTGDLGVDVLAAADQDLQLALALRRRALGLAPRLGLELLGLPRPASAFFCSASLSSPSAFFTAAIRTLLASLIRRSDTSSLAFASASASCSVGGLA